MNFYLSFTLLISIFALSKNKHVFLFKQEKHYYKNKQKISSKLSKSCQENKKEVFSKRVTQVLSDQLSVGWRQPAPSQMTTERSIKSDDGFIRDPRSHSWSEVQTHCFLEHCSGNHVSVRNRLWAQRVKSSCPTRELGSRISTMGSRVRLFPNMPKLTPCCRCWTLFELVFYVSLIKRNYVCKAIKLLCMLKIRVTVPIPYILIYIYFNSL